MRYSGEVQNGVIVLDNGVDLPNGTIVRVDVEPARRPRRGSPAAVLRLAGTLTEAEADAILQTAQDCRRVDRTLWGRS